MPASTDMALAGPGKEQCFAESAADRPSARQVGDEKGGITFLGIWQAGQLPIQGQFRVLRHHAEIVTDGKDIPVDLRQIPPHDVDLEHRCGALVRMIRRRDRD